MPYVPEFAAKGQEAVLKAVDAVVDKVPGSQAVVDQVIATANELLTLADDIQTKVIAALKSNA